VLRVELLDATHDRGGFDCGVEPLNRYLQQIARQHMVKGISKTFVLVDEHAAAPKPVLGFFTISLCQVLGQQVPAKWARKLPEQIPAMRLGRLAVAQTQLKPLPDPIPLKIQSPSLRRTLSGWRLPRPTTSPSPRVSPRSRPRSQTSLRFKASPKTFMHRRGQ